MCELNLTLTLHAKPLARPQNFGWLLTHKSNVRMIRPSVKNGIINNDQPINHARESHVRYLDDLPYTV